MTFAEFIEDLIRELQENKGWGEKEINFNTIDEGDLKLLSMHADHNSDVLYIHVGLPGGSPKQKMTFTEFAEICMKSLEDNKVWGEKEVRFIAIGRDGLEYLSVYDRDDTVCIDIGTEEDSDEWNKFVLGDG